MQKALSALLAMVPMITEAKKSLATCVANSKIVPADADTMEKLKEACDRTVHDIASIVGETGKELLTSSYNSVVEAARAVRETKSADLSELLAALGDTTADTDFTTVSAVYSLPIMTVFREAWRQFEPLRAVHENFFMKLEPFMRSDSKVAEEVQTMLSSEAADKAAVIQATALVVQACTKNETAKQKRHHMMANAKRGLAALDFSLKSLPQPVQTLFARVEADLKKDASEDQSSVKQEHEGKHEGAACV